MGRAIHEKNVQKGKRLVKALTKQQERAKVDKEMAVEGAHKKLERLEKEVAELKKELKKMSGQYDKLYAWMSERQRQQAQEDGE